MEGSIDTAGNAVLRWNIQEDKLYSPDGAQHCLPCEDCGDPQWVSLLTVSVICPLCAPPLDDSDGPDVPGWEGGFAANH